MFRRLTKLISHTVGQRCSNVTPRIRISGRDTFDYIHGDRRATVYCELQIGRIERMISIVSIRKWHPPHEDEEMTREQRDEVLHRLTEYFDKCGITYGFFDEEPESTAGQRPATS